MKFNTTFKTEVKHIKEIPPSTPSWRSFSTTELYKAQIYVKNTEVEQATSSPDSLRAVYRSVVDCLCCWDQRAYTHVVSVTHTCLSLVTV